MKKKSKSSRDSTMCNHYIPLMYSAHFIERDGKYDNKLEFLQIPVIILQHKVLVSLTQLHCKYRCKLL